MNSRIVIGLSIAVALALTAPAFGQYSGGSPGTGGGTTPGGVYTPPKGGYSSSTGIAIGAGAAAAAGVAYFALRNRGTLTGCVQGAGNDPILITGKGDTSYTLDESGLSLKAGDRVKLKGKKVKSSSGETTFTATKLVKDYGPCPQQQAAKQPATTP